MLAYRARVVVLEFREQCIWLRICYNTYRELYESGEETSDLLFEVAGHFFNDLNRILIDYIMLQVCKLTDPAKTNGNINLTVKYINELLSKMGVLTAEIKQYAKKMHDYRDMIVRGRNKVISHLDTETVLAGSVLGTHRVEDVDEYFFNMQRYTDAVGRAVGVGPLDYTVVAGAGDVQDLVMKLRDCANPND